MNQVQETYYLAKTAYDEIVKVAAERYAEIEHIADEDEEKYSGLCDIIDDEINTQPFYDILRQAENEVIRWGREQIRNLKEYAGGRQEFEEVFETAIKKPHSKIRRKVLELGLRLR